MQPPGRRRGRDRSVVGIVPAPSSRWASAAALGAGRVTALDRLVQLLRVAEQDDRLRRGRGRDHVRERDLAGLVDEQDVDLHRASIGEAQSHAVPAATSELAGCERTGNCAASVAELRRRVVGGSSASPLSGGAGPGARRPWPHRWTALEQVADHLVALRGDPDPPPRRDQARRSCARRCRSCRSPAAPGSRASSGPSWRAMRHAASSGLSPACRSTSPANVRLEARAGSGDPEPPGTSPARRLRAPRPTGQCVQPLALLGAVTMLSATRLEGCGSAADRMSMVRRRDRRADGADRPLALPAFRLELGLAGIEDRVTNRDPILLCREAVAPELLSLRIAVLHRFDRLEAADRVGLLISWLAFSSMQSVELPPRRLVLTSMPAQQLGKQPRGLLFDRAFRRVGRNVSGQTRLEPCDVIEVGRLLLRCGRVARRRPPDIGPDQAASSGLLNSNQSRSSRVLITSSRL